VHRFAPVALLSLLVIGAAPSPIPRPTVESNAELADKAQTSANQAQTDTIPRAPATIAQPSPSAVQTANEYDRTCVSQSDGENKKCQKAADNWWTWFLSLIQTGLQIVFSFIVAIATVFLAIFNKRLVRVTADMVEINKGMHQVSAEAAKATEAGAKAAALGAQVARLNLRADRPYLLVRQAAIEDFPDTGVAPYSLLPASPSMILSFKNYGKGPALIQRVDAALEVLSEVHPKGDYSQCIPHSVGEDAIGANQPFKLSVSSSPYGIVQAQLDDVRNGTRFLCGYGRIMYGDVFGHFYETGFCWFFRGTRFDLPGVPTVALPPTIIKGPLTHNYST
jgi:hypothetical protein